MRLLARWWPAIAWAGVIFIMSTGTFSGENTGRIIIPVLHWFFPHASLSALNLMHYVIRKCGHFTEYFVLSLLILRGIRADRHELRVRWAGVAVALVALYAVLDELHQSFVPGRGGLEFADVLLDTVGGAAAQALAALAALWVRLREKRKVEKSVEADA